MARALIVVDVQNDFCPGGSLGVDGGDDVARAVSDLIADATDRYQLVVATMDWHPGPDQLPDFAHFSHEPNFVDTWPAHCVQGTTGSELHDALELPDDAMVVRKGEDSAAYSGFEGRTADGRSLARALADHGVDAVDVVGLATDHCVRATALDARGEGLDVTVLTDLVAGVAPDTTAAALDELRAAGVHLRPSTAAA